MAEPGSAGRPVSFRGGGFIPKPVGMVGPLVFLAIVGIWEAGSRSGLIPPLILPAPSEALAALAHLVETGLLWKHLGASLQRLLVGWTVGTVLGIAVGVSIGLFSLARAGLAPIVAAIFPIPKIALLPLFVIWFGIGEGSKIATILFGTFFPTVIATYGGVDNVDRTLIRMGQSFGLSWSSIVRKIILPGALAGHPAGVPDLRRHRDRSAGRRGDDRRRVRGRRLYPACRQPDGHRRTDRRRRDPFDHGAERELGDRPGGTLPAQVADVSGRAFSEAICFTISRRRWNGARPSADRRHTIPVR